MFRLLWIVLLILSVPAGTRALGVQGQFFNDSDLETTGVSLWLYHDFDSGWQLFGGGSYRFAKTYQVRGNRVVSDDRSTDIGLAYPLLTYSDFSLEPFGVLQLSNWYFEYQNDTYIEQWTPQMEFGARLRFKTQAPFEPYGFMSRKTGFFEGDDTASVGLGISWSFFRSKTQPEFVPKPDQHDKDGWTGYWVVLYYQTRPQPWQMNYSLLDNDVKRVVTQSEELTLVYLGPFATEKRATEQWRRVWQHRQKSELVYRSIKQPSLNLFQ